MAEDHTKTVRIKRQSRVAQDDRGRNVWVGRVEESVELELVSTSALEKILKSDDGKTKTEIRKLVAGRRDGVLARDAATGVYQIVSDADLKTALEAPEVRDQPQQPAEELSLVSTQILRKILNPDGTTEYTTPKAGKKDRSGGFDPYNNN